VIFYHTYFNGFPEILRLIYLVLLILVNVVSFKKWIGFFAPNPLDSRYTKIYFCIKEYLNIVRESLVISSVDWQSIRCF